MADVLREFDKKQQKNILKEELSKQQISQIRSNIERIISSYRHIWDIYTELLQNSADAIIEKFGEDKIEQGRIELEINTEQREIIITDNGIGIEESEISKILVNGKSLKREKNTGKFGSPLLFLCYWQFCHGQFNGAWHMVWQRCVGICLNRAAKQH